jgi:hypothetical protein
MSVLRSFDAACTPVTLMSTTLLPEGKRMVLIVPLSAGDTLPWKIISPVSFIVRRGSMSNSSNTEVRMSGKLLNSESVTNSGSYVYVGLVINLVIHKKIDMPPKALDNVVLVTKTTDVGFLGPMNVFLAMIFLPVHEVFCDT